MNKDNSIYVEHIVASIGLIIEYTKGMSIDDFLSDSKTQDAVIRQLEIIGEATKNLSNDFRLKIRVSPGRKCLA